MLPTPSTSHVCFDNVYEPAEDSFLFLDTLSQTSEVSFLTQRFNPQSCYHAPLIVEVGTGSGVILSFIASNAASLLGRRDVLTLGTDLNSFACKAAAATVDFNVLDAPAESRAERHAFLGCVNGHLTTALRDHSVDVLIFNPPYVPSETVPEQTNGHTLPKSGRDELFERDSLLLALATDGGAEGMQVTDVLLGDLPRVLCPKRGVAYVLLCAQNKPEKVKQRIKDWGPGWSVDTVGTSGKQGGWEKLQIIRITRNAQ